MKARWFEMSWIAMSHEAADFGIVAGVCLAAVCAHTNAYFRPRFREVVTDGILVHNGDVIESADLVLHHATHAVP